MSTTRTTRAASALSRIGVFRRRWVHTDADRVPFYLFVVPLFGSVFLFTRFGDGRPFQAAREMGLMPSLHPREAAPALHRPD